MFSIGKMFVDQLRFVFYNQIVFNFGFYFSPGAFLSFVNQVVQFLRTFIYSKGQVGIESHRLKSTGHVYGAPLRLMAKAAQEYSGDLFSASPIFIFVYTDVKHFAIAYDVADE